jgi:thiol-disulfide isomerase/thioredoxin
MSRSTQALVLLRRGLPLFALAAFVWWASRIGAPTPALDLGSKPPALSLALADGSRFNVADSPQVVVLNFWAGYCAPCREEAPILSAFQAQNADVKLVGLSIEQETPAQAASQARQLGMNYAVGVADQAVLSRFRVQSVPTTYVIAKSGKIVLSHVGPIDSRQLATALASARNAG